MTSKTSPTRAPVEKRSLPRAVSLTLLVWSALLRLCPAPSVRNTRVR